MMNSTKITLDDIAKKLSVSKVTVSKALRDHPDIAFNTKVKIKNIADEMGYTPNFIARNLSAKKTFSIGLIVPKIAHYFFAAAVESIYETAYEHNYEIIMTVSQESVEYERKHLQNLLSMQVDGLLVSVTEQSNDASIYESVRKKGIPLVFFDRVLQGTGFSTVTTNDSEGAFQLITHAIWAGYTKIAHFAGYSHTNIGKNRLQGYKNAMSDNQLNIDKDWIIEGGFAVEDGYYAFRKLIKTKNLPELIFAVTYPVALGIYSAADEVGIRIPDDIDVVCFGGSDYNRFISPSITFTDQPAENIGRSATELLLRYIESPETRQEEHLVLPSTLVICETCLKKRGET